MTLTELHNDPKNMAKFMGWPYEDECVIHDHINDLKEEIYKLEQMIYQKGGRRLLTKEAATMARYADYLAAINRPLLHQSHDAFIRECAREGLGIKGRTVEEVRAKCIAARSDIFCGPDGNFSSLVLAPATFDVPPPPQRLP